MSKGKLAAMASLCALALPSTVYAQEGGFEGGLRTGYGIPLGKATDVARDDLSEGISGIIPLWVDAGYRIDQSLFVGGYFQYGYGFIGDTFEEACDLDGVSCSTNSIRVGAQIHYHFAPTSPANPWIGYGFGYEWFNIDVEGPGGEATITASGFEFANFQVGLDFMAAPNFYLGPFLSFSLDQYSSLDCSGSACLNVEDGSIDERSIHQWFVFGIRGGYSAFGG
jgi:hypothetical protein